MTWHKTRYQDNMSGWKRALHERGIASSLDTGDDRLASIRALVASGLPTYEYTFAKLDSLADIGRMIWQKYDGKVVARACPTAQGLSRYTIIGKTLDETIRQLHETIAPENSTDYTIILNEYDPAEYCGVIISSKDTMQIEMVHEPNLEGLCHGKTIPMSAEYKTCHPYSFPRMIFHNVEDTDARQLMWNTMKSISRVDYEDSSYPSYAPKIGYFEFCVSERTGKLRFIDYHQN